MPSCSADMQRGRVFHSGAHAQALLMVPRCALQVWGRAQAAAYIVRPNEPTMAAVTAMRMNLSLTHVWQGGQLQREMAVPYPLTPGTVSMHVRRAPWLRACAGMRNWRRR